MAQERTVLVRLKANVNDFVAGMDTAAAAVKGLSSEINTSNERTAWMAQGFLALAPALTPIGAVAIPAVTTLATQLGLAAAAAGVGIMAFQGVGTALKALNTYQLTPTSENLLKMQQAMAKLGPDGAQFVQFLDSLTPQLTALQDTARAGIFPGIEAGMTAMMSRLPEVQSVVRDIAGAMGQLAAEAGQGISGHGFDSFFEFLDRQARPLLIEMGHTIGNFVEGLANMAAAFEPLTTTFSHGFLEMSQSFSDWAAGLSDSSSFNDFINYALQSLPKVTDLLGSMANLFIQLAQAAAPVGDAMLPALTALMNVMATLADTPLGTVFIGLAAAVSLYGRAIALAQITTGGAVGKLLTMESGLIATTRAAWAGVPSLRAFGAAGVGAMTAFGASLTGMQGAVQKTNTGVAAFAGRMAPSAAAVGLLAFSLSDLDDKAGMANESMGALTGLMMGGPIGAGIGATVGAIMDLTHANDGLDDAVSRANVALQDMSQEGLQAAHDELQRQIADVNDASGHWYDFFTGITGYAHSDIVGDLFSKITGSAGDARRALSQVDSALANTKPKPLKLGGLTVDTTGAVNAYARASQAAADFAAEVTRVNNVLSGRADLRDYQQALDDFAKTVRQNGKSMDITTAKGRNVQAALDGIASTALRAAQDLKPLQRQRLLAQAREDLIGAAMQLGKTRSQAEALANKLLVVDKSDAKPDIKPQGIPKAESDLGSLGHHLMTVNSIHATPDVTVTGVDAAAQSVNGLRYAIDGLHDRTVTIRVNHLGGGSVTSSYGGHTAPQADGSVLDFYARGGIREKHVAQIAPAGAMRVWAEPETGGEAYIPLSLAKRDRSMAILSQVANRFGATIQQYANGGINANHTVSVVSGGLSDGDVQRIAAAVRGGARVGTAEGMGSLENPVRSWARQEIDDAAGFNQTMLRRRG